MSLQSKTRHTYKLKPLNLTYIHWALHIYLSDYPTSIIRWLLAKTRNNIGMINGNTTITSKWKNLLISLKNSMWGDESWMSCLSHILKRRVTEQLWALADILSVTWTFWMHASTGNGSWWKETHLFIFSRVSRYSLLQPMLQ